MFMRKSFNPFGRPQGSGHVFRDKPRGTGGFIRTLREEHSADRLESCRRDTLVGIARRCEPSQRVLSERRADS